MPINAVLPYPARPNKHRARPRQAILPNYDEQVTTYQAREQQLAFLLKKHDASANIALHRHLSFQGPNLNNRPRNVPQTAIFSREVIHD